MERYHFFASSCRQFGFNCKSLSELKSDETENEGALASVLKVLKQIHSMFFDSVSLFLSLPLTSHDILVHTIIDCWFGTFLQEPGADLADRDVRQVKFLWTTEFDNLQTFPASVFESLMSIWCLRIYSQDMLYDTLIAFPFYSHHRANLTKTGLEFWIDHWCLVGWSMPCSVFQLAFASYTSMIEMHTCMLVMY